MIRMSVNRILPLLLLLVFFTSCARKYKVEGSSSVTSLDGKMLFLKTLQNGQWVAVDSAEVIHGLFSMKGPVDSVMMVTLYMDDEGIMPLVLEDGKIEVSISNTQLAAKGTLLNDRLYEFIEKRNALELQIEELDRKEARMVLDGANLEDVHKELAKEGETLVEEMNNYVKQFIIDNNENVLGPSVFMMMCSTLPYPVMTPQIEDIMRTAPLAFKQNQLIKEFLSKAKENMQLIEEHQRVRQNASTDTSANKLLRKAAFYCCIGFRHSCLDVLHSLSLRGNRFMNRQYHAVAVYPLARAGKYLKRTVDGNGHYRQLQFICQLEGSSLEVSHVTGECACSFGEYYQ